MVFNLNGFNINQLILDPQGRVNKTWADVLNRAGFGIEVMYKRKATAFFPSIWDCSSFIPCNDRKPLCYALIQIDELGTCCSANYGDLCLRLNVLNSIHYP